MTTVRVAESAVKRADLVRCNLRTKYECGAKVDSSGATHPTAGSDVRTFFAPAP
jgi:hypothetical protein